MLRVNTVNPVTPVNRVNTVNTAGGSAKILGYLKRKWWLVLLVLVLLVLNVLVWRSALKPRPLPQPWPGSGEDVAQTGDQWTPKIT